MSTADVAAEASCLRQRLLGMRVANIYDVNAKVRLSCMPPIDSHMPGLALLCCFRYRAFIMRCALLHVSDRRMCHADVFAETCP